MSEAPAATKPKVTSASAWSKSKRHYVTLPSSAVVAMEIPDLPALVSSGKLPNELIDVAVKTASGGQQSDETTREAIEQMPEFYRFLVKLSVKEPPVDDALYDELPTEDKEMIVEIATRQRDIDAVYDHIGGLHTSKRWRTFRGLDDLDEAVAGT